MKKQILALFMGCVLLCGFSGCGKTSKATENKTTTTTVSNENLNKDKDDTDYKDIDIKQSEKSDYYTPIEIKNGYDSLQTDDQRKFYDLVLESTNSVAEEKDENDIYPCSIVNMENTVLTQAEIRLVITAVKEDNPMLFWLTDKFGFSNTEGYTAIQLYSYESPEKIKTMQNKLNKEVNKFINSVEYGLDDFSLELLAHDYIIDRCKYDDDVKDSDDDYLAFTPYGAIVNGNAVCEGYAKAFSYLLSQLGIESKGIVGKGSQELHMWNAVKIDGNWYYTDISWDDGKEYSRYDYFNITESQLKKDHTISKVYSKCSSDEVNGTNGVKAINFNFSVPECDSTEENYYVKKTVHFTDLYSYQNDEMTNALYNAANNKEKYFHIYIDPVYLEYNGAVDQLFVSGDQLFFTYIDTVNSMYPSNYIDKSGVSIIKKENLSVVTVKLSY